MKNIKTYRMYESDEYSSEPIRKVFNREQLSWLDNCSEESWKYNPQTGMVDIK